jgi:flavin-dependent dehydrogenase
VTSRDPARRAPRGGTSPVTIVGASTSGLLTATRLAQAGREVHVYERSRAAVATERTLIVTEEMLEVAGDVAKGSITNEIDAFEIIAGDRRLEVPLARPDLVIERAILLRDLVAQAESAGARIHWGRSFAGLETRGDDLMMLVKDESGPLRETHVPTLIGADGMSSRVASTLQWLRPPKLSLIQAIVRLPLGTPANVSTVWFDPERTPYFFWLVPESRTRGALGLISEDGATARKVLDSFLSEKGYDPVTYQAARIPAYAGWIPPHRRIGTSDVYLVGDAAGHVKVTTVGGIVTGFRGAVAVSEAVRTGRRDRAFGPLRRELDAHLWARRVLHGLDVASYESLLRLFGEPLKRRVGRTNRDHPVKMIVQSVLAQPRLIPFSVRALARTRRPESLRNGMPEGDAVASGTPAWGSLAARTAADLERAR